MPAHVKVPVGSLDPGLAVASLAVWDLVSTRLSLRSPGQGLGPLEGFWITHSLPAFPLPPGSSQSQSQGKQPGSPLQAHQTCYHPLPSMFRCIVAWPQHVSCVSCLVAPNLRPACATCTSPLHGISGGLTGALKHRIPQEGTISRTQPPLRLCSCQAAAQPGRHPPRKCLQHLLQRAAGGCEHMVC